MFIIPSFIGAKTPSSGGFDADYQAVLDYATTQGYTLPSSGQQTLQNQLVVDLKDAGVWSKLDTFGVFATDGDSDFSLIDWIRLTDYTAVNSPTFTTNVGFQGDGTSSYISSNFDTDLGASRQNNSSMGVRYSISAVYLARHTSLRGNITSINTGLTGMYNTATVTNTPSSWTIASGCNSIVRDSIGMYVYDDTSLVSTITNYNTVTGIVFELLRAASGSIYSTAQVNFAYFSEAFTPTEVIDLHNALNSYYTSL